MKSQIVYLEFKPNFRKFSSQMKMLQLCDVNQNILKAAKNKGKCIEIKVICGEIVSYALNVKCNLS